MYGQSKKIYTLYTEDRKAKEQKLNPNLPKEIKIALGLERQVQIKNINKDIDDLNNSIREDEGIANDEN